METFNPDLVRATLAGPKGDSARTLEQDFESSRAVNGLGSSAGCFLKDAVACLLVGLTDEAEQILAKARHWLRVAIETDERPRRHVPHRTECDRHANLALCNWLLDGVHDDANARLAAEHAELGLAAVKPEHMSGALSAALHVFLAARDYPRVVDYGDRYDQLIPVYLEPDEHGDGGVDYTAMCRVLAAHRLGRGYGTDEVAAAAESFLSAYIPVMLDRGWFEDIARWHKALDWDGVASPGTPREVILRSLAYLATSEVEDDEG